MIIRRLILVKGDILDNDQVQIDVLLYPNKKRETNFPT